jgi:hypothetical protein
MGFAYSTVGWINFFVAEVGASAALVGLLFVAVSINLTKIIQHPSLPGRAFEALTVLVVVLLVATFALVPGQSTTALGIEVTGTAVVGWATTAFIQLASEEEPDAPRIWMLSRVVTTQLAIVPMIASGVSLLFERGGGLYWIVAATVGSFLAALIDAWVLLVEIHR